MTGFGSRLSVARKRMGLSQKAIGEMIGYSRFTIVNWESEKTAPSYKEVERLAEILETTAEYLLKGTENNSATIPSMVSNTDSVTLNNLTNVPDLQHPKESDNGVHPGTGSAENGVSTIERAIWLPVFNYSEILEDFTMKPFDRVPLPAARFVSFNPSQLFLVRQDIPFRLAAEGDIPSGFLAIASKDFLFSNNKLYLVSLRGRCVIRRVTKYPDGAVDLTGDEGTKTVSTEEQAAFGFKILARVIARLPDQIYFFD